MYDNIIKLKDFGQYINANSDHINIKKILLSSIEYCKEKDPENYQIIIDFEGINYITSYPATQIFGTIIRNMGTEEFLKHISFDNINLPCKYVIHQIIKGTKTLCNN